MGGSTDGIRVTNNAYTLLHFLMQLLPLHLLCAYANLSLKTYLCWFKRNCFSSSDSALLSDGPSVHHVSMCLKNTEINGDFPKCLAEL